MTLGISTGNSPLFLLVLLRYIEISIRYRLSYNIVQVKSVILHEEVCRLLYKILSYHIGRGNIKFLIYRRFFISLISPRFDIHSSGVGIRS